MTRRREHPTTGWAYAGSRRQIQTHVNTPALTPLLDESLVEALPALTGRDITWVSPLASEKYAELQDETFWPGIGRTDLVATAHGWWPDRGGPSWDAVALAHKTGAPDIVVLIEAKAHPGEFGPAPCGAKAASRAMIRAAVGQTRDALKSDATTDTWLGGYYQLANRLAWARWLRDRGQDTVFAHVLFANDQSHKPTTSTELLDAARLAHATLDVSPDELAGWAATIVLEAAR